MLDELLGRATLKARIEELAEKNHHLQRRVDAEEQRRADAVSAKQDAEERVNRLEDRIAELTDRVERLDAESETDERSFRRRESLRGDRLSEFLSRLASIETGPEGALTATIDDASALPESVESAFDSHASLVRRAAPGIAYADDLGVVAAVLRPPTIPDSIDEWADSFRVDEEWFLPTGRFAFGIVRSDVFGLGIYDGFERVSVSGFESDVKSDHSKGGFSQGRFERIRDEQIADHLDRVETALEAVEGVDRTILVGERMVLDELEAYADVTDAVDARGDPTSALDHAFADFWTTDAFLL
ncbi:MAG: Vms1/Ankzf1 family peptidyl-tRNA hydrolase [Halobacteriota archaeon]